LELAAALAPAGFDDRRDGVCIHRAGTVLYLCPLMPKLLGFECADQGVGLSLVDLFAPRDRGRVASAIEGVARGVPMPETRVELRAAAGSSGMYARVTALRATRASPPVDVLYVRDAESTNEDGPGSSMRDGDESQEKTGRSAVLICDDEARLGALTAGLLAEYGFVPVTADTGDQALARLASGQPPIDVLLLDVNLSAGRSARDVLSAMSQAKSSVRVVLTSGLAEEDVDPDLVSHPLVQGYVPKPYSVEQLIQTIQAALR
jgi:CheY-like chemotaxis protein